MTTTSRSTTAKLRMRGVVQGAIALGLFALAPLEMPSARAQEAAVKKDVDVTNQYLVKIEPSVNPVLFAKPFDLVILLDRNEAERIELPVTIPENKQVRPAGRPQRSVLKSAPGRVNETISIPFLALDTEDTKTPAMVLRTPSGGRIEIPALALRVVDPDAPKTDPAQPPAGAVDGAAAVTTAAAPTSAVERAQRHFSYDVADTRPWAVIVTLVASIFALLSSIWIERLRVFTRDAEGPAPVVDVAPRRAAHEVAIERLDALLNAPYLRNGEVELFVEKLMNEVLRDYLQDRFDLAAETQTTAELTTDLLAVGHPAVDVPTVRAILEDADLVKFARAEMAQDVAHSMAGNVRRLILATAERTPVTEDRA